MTDFDDRVSTSSPVVAHETPETSGKLRIERSVRFSDGFVCKITVDVVRDET